MAAGKWIGGFLGFITAEFEEDFFSLLFGCFAKILSEKVAYQLHL